MTQTAHALDGLHPMPKDKRQAERVTAAAVRDALRQSLRHPSQLAVDGQMMDGAVKVYTLPERLTIYEAYQVGHGWTAFYHADLWRPQSTLF